MFYGLSHHVVATLVIGYGFNFAWGYARWLTMFLQVVVVSNSYHVILHVTYHTQSSSCGMGKAIAKKKKKKKKKTLYLKLKNEW